VFFSYGAPSTLPEITSTNGQTDQSTVYMAMALAVSFSRKADDVDFQNTSGLIPKRITPIFASPSPTCASPAML